MLFARGAEGGVGWHGSGCESIRIEASCIFNEDLKFQPDYFGVNVLGTFVSCCILLSQVPSTDVGCIVLHSILGCASDMSPNKPLAFDEALLRWDAVVKVRGQVLFVREPLDRTLSAFYYGTTNSHNPRHFTSTSDKETMAMRK